MSDLDHLLARQAELRAQIKPAQEELWTIYGRLARLGHKSHPHGDGTYAVPSVFHEHPFEEDHEHDEETDTAYAALMDEARLNIP